MLINSDSLSSCFVITLKIRSLMKKKILYLLTCVGLCWSSCTNEVDEFIGNVEPSTRSVSTALNANLASLFTGGARH